MNYQWCSRGGMKESADAHTSRFNSTYINIDFYLFYGFEKRLSCTNKTPKSGFFGELKVIIQWFSQFTTNGAFVVHLISLQKKKKLDKSNQTFPGKPACARVGKLWELCWKNRTHEKQGTAVYIIRSILLMKQNFITLVVQVKMDGVAGLPVSLFRSFI